jgi:hypothetical protein
LIHSDYAEELDTHKAEYPPLDYDEMKTDQITVTFQDELNKIRQEVGNIGSQVCHVNSIRGKY